MCLILGIVPPHSLHPGHRINRYIRAFFESVISLILASRATGVNNTSRSLLSHANGVSVDIH